MHTDPETRFPISAVQMPCIVKNPRMGSTDVLPIHIRIEL